MWPFILCLWLTGCPYTHMHLYIHSNLPVFLPFAKGKILCKELASLTFQIHICASNSISFRNSPFSWNLFPLDMESYLVIVGVNWPLFSSLLIFFFLFSLCNYCLVLSFRAYVFWKPYEIRSHIKLYLSFLLFLTFCSKIFPVCFNNSFGSVHLAAVLSQQLKLSATTCVFDHFTVFTVFTAC